MYLFSRVQVAVKIKKADVAMLRVFVNQCHGKAVRLVRSRKEKTLATGYQTPSPSTSAPYSDQDSQTEAASSEMDPLMNSK